MNHAAKKKLLSMVLAAAMVFQMGILPASATAAGSTTTTDAPSSSISTPQTTTTDALDKNNTQTPDAENPDKNITLNPDAESGSNALTPNTESDGNGSNLTASADGDRTCTHQHDDACYTIESQCIHVHTADCSPEGSAEPTACTHTCSAESGCLTKVLACTPATGTAFASEWVDYGSTTEVQNIDLSKVKVHVANKQLLNTTANMQYRYHNTVVWYDCTDGVTNGVEYFDMNPLVVRQKDKPSNELQFQGAQMPNDVGMNYSEETTLSELGSEWEYKIGDGAWTTCTGKALPIKPSTTYMFRSNATETHFGVPEHTITTPARPVLNPEEITMEADDELGKTKITNSSKESVRYRVASSKPTSFIAKILNAGATVSEIATEGQHLYCFIASDYATNFKSEWVDCGPVKVKSDFDMTKVAYDVAKGQLLNTTANMQYQLTENHAWVDCAETSTTGITFVAGAVSVRQKDKTDNTRLVGTIAPAAAAPNAPTVASKTTSSVTLVAGSGNEYSKDGGRTWQDATVFGGLSQNTPYQFVTRIKATASSLCSETSAALEVTLESSIVPLPKPEPPKPEPSEPDRPAAPSQSEERDRDRDKNRDREIVHTPAPPVGEDMVIPVNGNSGSQQATMVTATITDQMISNVMDLSANNSGINVIFSLANTGGTVNSLDFNLPKSVQETLLREKVGSIVVRSNTTHVSVTLDASALIELNEQAGDDVNIITTIYKNNNLTGNAKAAIGSRPVFDLKAVYGTGEEVENFGTGKVTVSIPYTLGANEAAGSIYAVYAKDNGSVQWLSDSVYNSTTQMLRFSTNHFSIYGVGYKTNSASYSDLGSHWAKNDIQFVINRGLLTGTSATTFAPNQGITRGMMVTALGRLAKIDPKPYRTTEFTDVADNSEYAPYIAWATEMGIVSGITHSTFEPNRTMTREEMAVMMANYSDGMGYQLPAVQKQIKFADENITGSWASDAVTRLQMQGILIGRSGKRFAATSTATRAEASSMLRRFVELTLSSDAGKGWIMNENGQWLYIQNGQRVTGKQTINGKTYTFDQYGAMTAQPN